MAASDVTTLLNDGGCFNCVTPGIWNLIRLAYLARIVAGDTSVADISTLLAESGCFACLTPGEQIIAELVLLKQLQESGAGGSGGISNGSGDPTSAPSNTAVTNIYFDDDSGGMWEWPAGGSAWVQRI